MAAMQRVGFCFAGLAPVRPAGEELGLMRSLFAKPEVRATVELRVSEAEECVCRVHVPVVHSVEGAPGCEAMALGSAEFIAAATKQEGARHCLALPDTRRQDAKASALMLREAFLGGVGVGGNLKWLKRFGTSKLLDMHHFGAGYCYLWAAVPSTRARGARVVGPYPFLVVAAAFVAVFGHRGSGRIVELIRVDEGRYHCVLGEREVSNVARNFCLACARVLREEPEARVGAGEWAAFVDPFDLQPVVGRVDGSEEFASQAVEWLCGVGLSSAGRWFDDLCGVVTVTALVPPSAVALKDRVRVYENIGDAAFKMAVASRVLVAGGGAEVASREGARLHSNSALALVTTKPPFSDFLQVGSLLPTSKSRANMVEAFMGWVFVHHGVQGFVKVADAVSLLPVFVGEVKVRVEPMTSSDRIATISALLKDASLRGASDEGLLARVRMLLGSGGESEVGEK